MSWFPWTDRVKVSRETLRALVNAVPPHVAADCLTWEQMKEINEALHS